MIEAQQIGFGGSGRNVGLVNAGLWLPPQDVRAAMGERHGPRLWSFGDGPDYVFSLIERHQIRCEATRTGTIHAAHAPAGLRDLARRAGANGSDGRAGRDAGCREAAAAALGTDVYVGGLLDHRAGTINPMGYAGAWRAPRARRARGSAPAYASPACPRRRAAGGSTTDHGTGDRASRGAGHQCLYRRRSGPG